MEGLAFLVIIIYLLAHIPAFVLLIIGLTKLKKSPSTAKVLLIIAGVYFVVGGGICGALLN